MTLDITLFGYGAGFVMVGWFAGMVFNVLMKGIGGGR